MLKDRRISAGPERRTQTLFNSRGANFFPAALMTGKNVLKKKPAKESLGSVYK